MHAPRGAQGGRGRGAKEKTPKDGGQMQVDAMAGIVRLAPGGEMPPDATTKKGRGQPQEDAPHPGKGGAKGETLQKSSS